MFGAALMRDGESTIPYARTENDRFASQGGNAKRPGAGESHPLPRQVAGRKRSPYTANGRDSMDEEASGVPRRAAREGRQLWETQVSRHRLRRAGG